ncbi:MAG TPA: LCP family protein [Candidatus Gastranaerophilales bacterium]|nr:LCP family protein [Candidatus Gastranaerophilales bacterium]
MEKNTKSTKNYYSSQSRLKEQNRLNYIVKTAKENKSSDSLAVKWALKALLASLLVLGIIYYFIEAEKNPKLMSFNKIVKKTGFNSNWINFSGTENILLLGVDSNGKMSDPFTGTRSDTIIVFSISQNGKSVNAISIPRDSKVYLSEDKGVDKINAAHALGGPELTINTIKDTFGIDINHYVVLNYDGVKDFIRAIDGVPINIEKRMYYRDRSAGLRIDLQPGYHVLDANEAEGYLRFRHDAIGDIGRIKRQQWFLAALLNKLKSQDTLFKAPELMGILSKNIRTDLSPVEVTKLISILPKIKPENIKVATLPGNPSKHGYISYWILDADKTQTIIDTLIYRERPDMGGEELTINLFYSPEHAEKIDEIVENINDLGFRVKFQSQERKYHSQIIAHTKKAVFSKVDLLRENIPELNNSQYIVEPEEDTDSYSDFTIVLAN